MQIKKIVNISFCMIIVLGLLMPIIFMNNKRNVVSDIDNKVLPNFPIWGDDNFTLNIESYLEDRIGGRAWMISTYANINNVLANELTHPTYTYGQDGYIFFNMHNNIIYNDYHKTFAEMVYKIQNYCEERGVHFYFMFNPEKISVYRRYLPKGVNYNDYWVNEMMCYMDKLGIKYVNTTELLTNLSYSEQIFNRKYDAGHWNDLGCFYATNELLQRINEDIPEVKPLSINLFDVSTTVKVYLPNSQFKITEEVPVFSLKTSYKNITSSWVNEVDINSSFKHFHYYINNAEGAKDLPKTLIFQGSYYNRGPQFLVSATSEDIGIHNYQNILNFDYYFNIFQPDVVIFDVAEYVFSDRYFSSLDMENMDLNPSIINYSEPFDAQVENLKKSAIFIPINATVNIVPGVNVDKIIINSTFSDIKYAYIINNGIVIDLKNEETRLSASCPHGFLTKDSKPIMYIEQSNNRKLFMEASTIETTIISDQLEASPGANVSRNNITFTTDLKDNEFNRVNIQIYESVTNIYLGEIINVKSRGEYSNVYVHNCESGLYKIRLKINSNLKDEYVDATAYLIQGNEYHYSFTVSEMKKKSVSISDYIFYGECSNEGKDDP